LFADLSDDQLIEEVKRLAACERRATAELIASLAELDTRRLYLREGCSSLFTYCTRVLRLSEHAAYGRIEAARAARRFPLILELLAGGLINLTTVTLLAPVLTTDNHLDLLSAAQQKSKREVEIIVASVRPQEAVPAAVRRLPSPVACEPRPNSQTAAPDCRGARESAASPARPAPAGPGKPAVVAPLAPERFRVQLTVSGDTYAKLRRVQDLMRHVVPNGDVAIVFDRALSALLAHLEKKTTGAAAHARGAREAAPGSRRIPAAVRREVWKRDNGRCAFVGTEGRCAETGFLEFHHVVPFADGGPTTVANLQLRCRSHNRYEADRWFGPTRCTRSEPST
jgi:hypothetical protein